MVKPPAMPAPSLADPPQRRLGRWQTARSWARLIREAEALWFVDERVLRRLASMHPDSAEAAVVRTWLDWITGLPWSNCTEDNLDIPSARKILNEDHYDLEKVKKRIVEYLAVRKLKADMKGPILCLVGPPGVGKTSLGRSVARALGRREHGPAIRAETPGHRSA